MLDEEYDVYISWTADETNGSDDAHFGVYKGSTGGTLVYEEDLDQTADPTEETGFIDFSSAKFEKLASVTLGGSLIGGGTARSEERRVGKERSERCRSRWSPDH